jgi:hypothetical protein
VTFISSVSSRPPQPSKCFSAMNTWTSSRSFMRSATPSRRAIATLFAM